MSLKIQPITDSLSVSAQISACDLPEIKSQGFRAVICNRPDGEEFGQPEFEEIKRAAESAGLAACHVPVLASLVADADVERFKQAIRALPEPVLAYCRSGTRSAMLWALSQPKELPVSEILASTQRAGFDLSALAERIGSS